MTSVVGSLPDVVRAGRRGRVAQRAAALAPAAVVVLSLLASAMMLGWPLGYDQGTIASVGDVVARGGAPYRDGWDVKGPLVYWLFAAVEWLAGPRPWALRALDVAVAWGTAWLLHRQLRTLVPAWLALAAAAAWPLVVAAQTWDESLQPDLWVASATLAVVALVVRPGRTPTAALLGAGALVGAMTLVKPFYAIFGVLPAIAAVGAGRSVTRALLLPAAGGLAALAAGVALLAAQGALEAAWAVYIRYNVEVYADAQSETARVSMLSARGLYDRIVGSASWLAVPRILVAAPLVLAGALELARLRPVVARPVLAWLALALALVVLQGKFYPYHWVLAYPSALLLAAVGAHALVRDARAARSAPLLLVSGLLVALAVGAWLVRPVRDLRRTALHAAGRYGDSTYVATLLEVSETNPATEATVAAWLRANTPPGEPFLHWSVDGALAYLAQRPHLVRFHNKRDVMRSRSHPIVAGYHREILDAMRDRPPAVVVLGEGLGRDRREILPPLQAVRTEFPALATIVERDYVRLRAFGDLEVWGRRGTTWGRAR